MTTKISIRIPSALVSPAQFAELEGLSRNTVYAWCCRGKLAKYMQPKKKWWCKNKNLLCKIQVTANVRIIGAFRF